MPQIPTLRATSRNVSSQTRDPQLLANCQWTAGMEGWGWGLAREASQQREWLRLIHSPVTSSMLLLPTALYPGETMGPHTRACPCLTKGNQICCSC